jgi:hypothetical protein
MLDPAGAPRRAPNDPPGCLRAAAEQAVQPKGLDRVVRARRVEAAAAAQEVTERELVNAHKRNRH